MTRHGYFLLGFIALIVSTGVRAETTNPPSASTLSDITKCLLAIICDARAFTGGGPSLQDDRTECIRVGLAQRLKRTRTIDGVEVTLDENDRIQPEQTDPLKELEYRVAVGAAWLLLQRVHVATVTRSGSSRTEGNG
jgi:hypothetical protein